jgi:alpha-D-xyloside xylohydrolase
MKVALRNRSFLFVLVISAVISFSLPMLARDSRVKSVNNQSDGVLVSTDAGVLRLQVWSDRVIRVSYAERAELPASKSFSVIGEPQSTAWTLTETADAIVVETKAVRVRVDRSSSAVSFLDLTGNAILEEVKGGRQFSPTPVQSLSGTAVQAAFVLRPQEQIYGLGQQQDGALSHRGSTVHLQQKNTTVAVPVMVSSSGYGVLWDNPSVTDVEIGVKGAEGIVSWKSEFGSMLDYYFSYGPDIDRVVQGYRQVTGQAPLMPRWLWGFFQCKERYASQSELVDVMSQYRERRVPIDGVIQDWQYWPKGGWGSHEFEQSRYPDPAGMLNKLHEMNAHVFVSVWARFDVGTQNGDELKKAGALYEPVLKNVYPVGEGRWYDAFNSDGRRIYWNQISSKLFKLGLDGWWLDASEAELSGNWGEFRGFQTAAGPGAAVYNAYPLMTTTGVYKGQRAENDKKRVAILTRSAYAGQQRNAAITWSGDINGTWDVLAKQIPAGLNFSISGIPYWNTDIGGFFGGDPKDPAYQELFTRWFQFGAFNPMFRVHGTGASKEFWQWDERTQQIWRRYVSLRYRLLPYTYSTSWQVTHDGGTMMRPLVMDFAEDREALNIADQYMFGRGLMINPVVQAGATSRSVYLPGKDLWYDFWTGNRVAGGQRIHATAPIETMPIYVPAGTILALGPELQYSNEKPADALEVRVYRGANGSFTLYEDEGDSYNYEKGVYSTIPFTWNENTRTLTIGARQGDFPGMLKTRSIHVVFVKEGHGSGVPERARADRIVKYEGKPVVITAR